MSGRHARSPWNLIRLTPAALTQEAFDTFRKAVEAGYGNKEWAARDTDLACLPDVPEFRSMVGLEPA